MSTEHPPVAVPLDAVELDRGAPISRREAMHRGLAGAAGLLLAGHQAAGAPAEGQSPKAKSVIQIWA
ncbi:MAG: hypothetical protein HQ567_06945, partial [Candidatus Nealsonbacteria bacterium]|nr:hypothetical protein [Candidatus Nealsonbacteria bacterium]